MCSNCTISLLCIQGLVAFGKTKLFISTPRTLLVLERERKRQLVKVVSRTSWSIFILQFWHSSPSTWHSSSLPPHLYLSILISLPFSLSSSPLTSIFISFSFPFCLLLICYSYSLTPQCLPPSSHLPSALPCPIGDDPSESLERSSCEAVAEEDKGSNPDCPQVQVHRSTQTASSGGGGGGGEREEVHDVHAWQRSCGREGAVIDVESV